MIYYLVFLEFVASSPLFWSYASSCALENLRFSIFIRQADLIPYALTYGRDMLSLMIERDVKFTISPILWWGMGWKVGWDISSPGGTRVMLSGFHLFFSTRSFVKIGLKELSFWSSAVVLSPWFSQDNENPTGWFLLLASSKTRSLQNYYYYIFLV